MKRAVWVMCGLVVAGVGVWWWHSVRQPMPPANYPPTARGPWVAFGDSLTRGYGAEPGRDYPTVLGQRLGVKILNHGRDGDTTAAALARLEEVVRLQPRVVLLCLGGNDSLQRLPPEQTFANLGRIIDRLHREGTFVVLLGVRSASVRDHYALSFRRLARTKRVVLVANILDGVLGHPERMADFIHPNEQGYAVIAERVATALQPCLAGLR